MKEIVEFAVGIGLLVGVVISGLFGLIGYFEYRACETLAMVNPERNFEWQFWSGCMIEMPDGTYWPRSQVDYVNNEVKVRERSN
jgi:hypothetical protein